MQAPLKQAGENVAECERTQVNVCMYLGGQAHLQYVWLASGGIIWCVPLVHSLCVRSRDLLDHLDQLRHGSHRGIAKIERPGFITIHHCHHFSKELSSGRPARAQAPSWPLPPARPDSCSNLGDLLSGVVIPAVPETEQLHCTILAQIRHCAYFSHSQC